MSRLAVPLNLHIPPEPTKNLAKRVQGINDYVAGINVQCTVCRERGRVNSKLLGKGKRPPFVCGPCRAAT